MDKQSRGGAVLVELLLYIFISIIFCAMIYELLYFVIARSHRIVQKIDQDINFFMAIDYLRQDFWWHSVSTATISEDGRQLVFVERIGDQTKTVRYIIEKSGDYYQLKRVANNGVNVVYTSSKQMYFYAPNEKIWAINIEGYDFEMVNLVPADVREQLKIGNQLPYFLVLDR